jgi:uncharacterized protein (DUF488 family)
MPGPTVFTVGHGARSFEGFLSVLRSADIGRLVDVRTAPGSRKHPQFGRDALVASLGAEGIAYLWRKELGGWRKPVPDSPHVAIRSPAFRGYADHMESGEFDAALSWLIATSRDVPSAIMCAETLWWRCHRRMISDGLTVRGCRVVHLIAPEKQEAHRLHPAARVAGTGLIYDVSGPEQPALLP